ncbi:hypothetical protein [Ekhidna sp.]|uniref:hypothetical protein n=1 Tax=Ekhidna sp. TaxID=2608089 RepID=UPI003513E5F2
MRDILKYALPWIVLIAVSFLFNFLGWDFGNGGVGLLIAVGAIYYFNLDNPHPAFKKATIITLFVWLISLQLRRELAEIGNWLPALAAASFVFVYFQRFRAREDKHWVDYLKLIGVIGLLPATYFEADLTGLIASFLAFIYLLDRLIIRRQMNKTAQIITFCTMGLICITFLVFSFIKASEAEKQRAMAEIAQQEAMQRKDEAIRLQQIAEEAAAEARMQAAMANQIRTELEACKQSK